MTPTPSSAWPTVPVAAPKPPDAAADTTLASRPGCPAPLAVSTAHLYGLWQVNFHNGPLPTRAPSPTPPPADAHTTILFERHPEHTDSLRGAMKPIASAHSPSVSGTVWLSGDLEDGELILDESTDGQRITAVWVGHPTSDGCGNVFQGNRRLADTDTLQTFTMTKAPGWR